jgi:peroxiredoxin
VSARPPLRLVLAIGALAVFTIWITWRAKAIEMGSRMEGAVSRLVGKPAPDFSLETLDGQKVSLADYHGKTLVATFWASWCGPCRLEIPVLTKFYREQHKADSNFEIVAISIDTKRGDAEAAAKGLKMPFPVLLDPDSKAAQIYQVDAIPTLFVIDRSGRVTSSHTGFSMGMDILLASQLGIKNYSSVGGTR